MLSESEIEKKVDQSKFIFIGTIKKIGASNLAALTANTQLVLVTINKVAHGPTAFVGVEGTTVTVKIPAKTKLKTGDTRLFFTNRLMYGENLAVEAIHAEPLNKDNERTVNDVKNAVASIERNKQLASISAAAAIVEGKVVKMEESPINKRYPLSFKAPYWISLIIEVSKIIKGKYDGDTIEVFINKGGEPGDSTPLEVEIGKRGVWLLDYGAIFKDLKINDKFYVIEESEDFLQSYEYVILTHPNLP